MRHFSDESTCQLFLRRTAQPHRFLIWLEHSQAIKEVENRSERSLRVVLSFAPGLVLQHGTETLAHQQERGRGSDGLVFLRTCGMRRTAARLEQLTSSIHLEKFKVVRAVVWKAADGRSFQFLSRWLLFRAFQIMSAHGWPTLSISEAACRLLYHATPRTIREP